MYYKSAKNQRTWCRHGDRGAGQWRVTASMLPKGEDCTRGKDTASTNGAWKTGYPPTFKRIKDTCLAQNINAKSSGLLARCEMQKSDTIPRKL